MPVSGQVGDSWRNISPAIPNVDGSRIHLYAASLEKETDESQDLQRLPKTLAAPISAIFLSNALGTRGNVSDPALMASGRDDLSEGGRPLVHTELYIYRNNVTTTGGCLRTRWLFSSLFRNPAKREQADAIPRGRGTGGG